MVQTATFLPVFLVGIPAGALADVFDRRTLLIFTQAMMLLSAGAMAVLTFADSLSPTGVLSLTFMLGIGSALMAPAWMAIQPDLVGKEHFAQAVSLSSLTYNVGRVDRAGDRRLDHRRRRRRLGVRHQRRLVPRHDRGAVRLAPAGPRRRQLRRPRRSPVPPSPACATAPTRDWSTRSWFASAC